MSQGWQCGGEETVGSFCFAEACFLRRCLKGLVIRPALPEAMSSKCTFRSCPNTLMVISHWYPFLTAMCCFQKAACVNQKQCHPSLARLLGCVRPATLLLNRSGHNDRTVWNWGRRRWAAISFRSFLTLWGRCSLCQCFIHFVTWRFHSVKDIKNVKLNRQVRGLGITRGPTIHHYHNN